MGEERQLATSPTTSPSRVSQEGPQDVKTSDDRNQKAQPVPGEIIQDSASSNVISLPLRLSLWVG